MLNLKILTITLITVILLLFSISYAFANTNDNATDIYTVDTSSQLGSLSIILTHTINMYEPDLLNTIPTSYSYGVKYYHLNQIVDDILKQQFDKPPTVIAVNGVISTDYVHTVSITSTYNVNTNPNQKLYICDQMLFIDSSMPVTCFTSSKQNKLVTYVFSDTMQYMFTNLMYNELPLIELGTISEAKVGGFVKSKSSHTTIMHLMIYYVTSYSYLPLGIKPQ